MESLPNFRRNRFRFGRRQDDPGQESAELRPDHARKKLADSLGRMK